MASYYVVVGAGITGLVAAHGLASRGLPVLLVECRDRIGGLLRVTMLEGAHVPIEEYYHAVFAGEADTLGLIADLGLADRLEWSHGTSGCLCGHRIYRVSTPFDLLRYRPLTLPERLRVGLVTLQMQRAKDVSPYDGVTAREFVTTRAGAGVYRKFFEPLMRAKYADDADHIAASWLVSRIRLRKQRGKVSERLGYLEGGFKTLLDALEARIVASGGTILLNSRIEAAEVRDRRVTRITVNGQRHDVAAVISTVPPAELATVLKPQGPLLDLCDLPYQGSVCVLLALDRSLTGVWWTNIMNGNLCFSAVVEHTQFRPAADYGSHIHYLASYPEHGSRFFDMPADEVFREYFASLREVFPDVSERNVVDYRVVVDRHSALIPRVGVAHRIRALGIGTSIDNLFLGGIVNSYPERSMNASVARARECVAAALTVNRSQPVIQAG
jgi:protoporphyrinogen oxidase